MVPLLAPRSLLHRHRRAAPASSPRTGASGSSGSGLGLDQLHGCGSKEAEEVLGGEGASSREEEGHRQWACVDHLAVVGDVDAGQPRSRRGSGCRPPEITTFVFYQAAASVRWGRWECCGRPDPVNERFVFLLLYE
uniref:Predicted protein n=1 Tax=Hordeum vulgare subsp. vulgare TaxID=112509 RepID=F2DY10_HORVV|nr:predicted protein [Hordeum vulgare subsp. vulgare]